MTDPQSESDDEYRDRIIRLEKAGIVCRGCGCDMVEKSCPVQCPTSKREISK